MVLDLGDERARFGYGSAGEELADFCRGRDLTRRIILGWGCWRADMFWFVETLFL